MNNASLHFPPDLPELEGATSVVEFPSHAKDGNASMDGESVLNDRDDVFDGASADVQSSEGAFVDATSSLSNMEAGFVPLRVRISVDSDDEDCDASLATSENFDSVSERMATLSNTNSVSPSGSFKEFFARSEVLSITFNGALRQLNELNSGVASLDTSLLENTSEEGFRFRVMEIALSNHLSLGDEVVHDILNALSPIVRENFKQNNSVKEEAGYYCIGDMPVAQPTADDDDDDDSDGLDDVYLEGCQETSDFERSEDREFFPYSARGLPVRVAIDDQSEEHEVYHFSPSLKLSISSQMANPEVEVQHISLPSDEIENQNSVDYEHAKGELSMSYEEPDLMHHCAKNAENQDRPLGENDLLKYMKDAPSCGLIEADANEYTTPYELQTSLNKAKSMHESKQVAMTKYTSVSRSADGNTRKDSGIYRQQLEETKQEARRSLDAASLQQIVESISTVGHAVDSTALSTQLKVFKDILGKRQARFEGEEGEGARKEGLEVKDLLINDNLLYGIKGGIVAGYPEVVFVNELEMHPEEHLFLNRKIREEADDRVAKSNDEEEETEPTDERVLNLKFSTASATGMPFIGNARPALCAQRSGLGRLISSLIYASHAVPWRNGASVSSSKASETDHAKGINYTRKKLQMIGVKFLRLAHRLEQSAHNVVVAQVLHRLELIGQQRSGCTSTDFLWENLMSLAEKQEEAGQGDLDFECTILVLGKSGVGKSATLNSLFDEAKSRTDAYKAATKKVNEIIGTVKGLKLRIIDTPGLFTSFADQQFNIRIMSSVKHYIKKSPPDIVLYFDRLDMQCRDHGDFLLLRTITDTLGGAIWYNAIVVLTHGSSPPPDGANGSPISYELFIAQRSHVVQQTIRQAAGDMQLMNPVSLVENHVTCRVNKAGHSVLPNGQAWKPQLLLLCFASKILAEANTLMKLHDDSSPGKSFWVRPQVPPLPFLLSSMLQSRAEMKLRNEQVDDEEVSDPDEEADSDDEEDYDDLPSFRRLTRDELRLLDKEQWRLYHEELEYREKLFMKKQLKDEQARKKERKRRLAALPKGASDSIEEHLEEAPPAAVPVPMPDIALPPSFDSGNPTHMYRFLDTASQWLVHPVLDTHGWDHDSGYDGLNLEKVFVISKKVPVSISGQITKDKKKASVQMECATTLKVGDGKVTQAGLDIQTLGEDVLYTIRSEMKFSNLKKNKTTCGLSVTMLGDTVAAGIKLEDCLLVGKRFKLVMNGGALTGKKDVAYGGSLEASLRDKDHPIGNSLTTLGVSIMNWHGDFAIGGNLQSQFLLGRAMVVGRANLNNKKSGQISIRVSSSDQLQMAFIGLIPLLRAFVNNKISGSNQLK